MTQTTTYAGSTLQVALAGPTLSAPPVATDFDATTFTAGASALHEVPEICREWTKVKETLVSSQTNVEIKGSATWKESTFKLSKRPSDAAQAIYEQLEAGREAIGAFKLTLSGGQGTLLFNAQVSLFSIVDGGGQDSINTCSVKLLLQADPVFVPAP